MDEKLRADIEEIVKSIFANREESDQRAALEQTLEKSAKVIEDLTDELAAVKEELATSKETASRANEDLVSKLAASEDSIEKKDIEITALTEKFTASESKIEELTKEKAELTSQLENIKLDQLVASRMAELVEMKIARKDQDVQSSKVRAMSDEEFEAYKAELVDVRNSIMAELETTTEDGSGSVAPAAIDKEKAAAAALNVEASKKTVASDYAALGVALAELIKEKSKS